jgi:hypothetical protein
MHPNPQLLQDPHHIHAGLWRELVNITGNENINDHGMDFYLTKVLKWPMQCGPLLKSLKASPLLTVLNIIIRFS